MQTSTENMNLHGIKYYLKFIPLAQKMEMKYQKIGVMLYHWSFSAGEG